MVQIDTQMVTEIISEGRESFKFPRGFDTPHGLGAKLQAHHL